MYSGPQCPGLFKPLQQHCEFWEKGTPSNLFAHCNAHAKNELRLFPRLRWSQPAFPLVKKRRGSPSDNSKGLVGIKELIYSIYTPPSPLWHKNLCAQKPQKRIGYDWAKFPTHCILWGLWETVLYPAFRVESRTKNYSHTQTSHPFKSFLSKSLKTAPPH